MKKVTSRWAMRTMLTFNGLRRRMTLGARALCVVDNAVLLVRHGYVGGLQLPGGAVEPGETAAEAAMRETLEETGRRPLGQGRLLGLYFSRGYTDRDHVALFVFDAVTEVAAPKLGLEIAEVGWFGLDDLPEDVTPATRARLDEWAGAPLSPYW